MVRLETKTGVSKLESKKSYAHRSIIDYHNNNKKQICQSLSNGKEMCTKDVESLLPDHELLSSFLCIPRVTQVQL
jgi:hypothetical protein